MTIGERIRERRKELNISQDELAKKLKYKSRSSINKIELGHYNLTQSKIKAIADALETTPSYIMGWTDREPVTPPPAEEFTQAEKGLVYAYREAPEPTKRIVDVALEPYKPGSSDDDPIQLDEATRKDLKKALPKAVDKDRAMFEKKEEDPPAPSKPSVPIVTGTVKKENTEYLDMIVNSEKDLLFFIEKAYSGKEVRTVKGLVLDALHEINSISLFWDTRGVCSAIAGLIKQKRGVLLMPYFTYKDILAHLKEVGVIQETQQQQQQVIQAGRR